MAAAIAASAQSSGRSFRAWPDPFRFAASWQDRPCRIDINLPPHHARAYCPAIDEQLSGMQQYGNCEAPVIKVLISSEAREVDFALRRQANGCRKESSA